MTVTRTSHTRSPSLISNPMSAEQALQYRSKSPLASPPKSPPPRGHRPSLSKGMSWLSRGSGHTSVQHPPSKPIRISEPQFTNVFEIMHAPRSGTLGSGATIVKTPQEALSAQLLEEEENEHEAAVEHARPEKDEHRKLPSAPKSPDLPPIPQEQTEKESPALQKPAPPPIASTSATLRPSLKDGSPGTSECSSLTSYLPANITSPPELPPFDPILVSPVPTGAIDPFKVIVSLETGTSTHRTTLTTLASRPSHLATYLTSLLSKPDSDSVSVQSHTSDMPSTPDSSFNSIFQHHLVSTGLLTQASSNIHVFLDRPSAPYEHILAYLRSAPSTPESPATLPRAVQLISSPSARLQALLELRDEASYLDLDELHKLCNDEIQRRESAFSHTRIGSTSSASLRSVHTFREQSTAGSESSQQSHRDRPRDRDHARDRDTIVTHRSAPKERDSVAMYDDQEAPPSLKISTSRTHMRSRSHGRNLDSIQAPLRSPPPLRATPPPGWI